jgi:hypothetical protein
LEVQVENRVLEFIRLLSGEKIEDLVVQEDIESGLFTEDDTAYTITKEIFKTGDCGRLYLILKFVFPEAVPYMVVRKGDESWVHVLTKIGDKYYDIEGEFDVTGFTIEESSEEEIKRDLLHCNYSFRTRGPII